MNVNQKSIIDLTMKLDLKTREYKKLCQKLDELKQNNIDPNDERLLKLKELFEKNSNEIKEINQKLKSYKEP